MAVNDIYEVSMLYSIKGEKCANVLHLREDVDPGSNNEQTVANAVKVGIWDGSLKLAVSNDVKLQVVRARRIDPTAGGPVDVVVNTDGSIAQDVMPPNNCVVISLYTARLDKSGRGRLHFSGAPKTQNQDGLLDTAAQTLWDAVANSFLSAITSGGGSYTAGIWSRKFSQFNPITAATTRSWHHTMRGRRMAAP